MKLTDFGEWSQVLATVESRLAGNGPPVNHSLSSKGFTSLIASPMGAFASIITKPFGRTMGGSHC